MVWGFFNVRAFAAARVWEFRGIYYMIVAIIEVVACDSNDMS